MDRETVSSLKENSIKVLGLAINSGDDYDTLNGLEEHELKELREDFINIFLIETDEIS